MANRTRFQGVIMIDDFVEFVGSHVEQTGEVQEYGIYRLVREFLDEYDYDKAEVLEYVNNVIIPRMKANIMEDRLTNINSDFKV